MPPVYRCLQFSLDAEEPMYTGQTCVPTQTDEVIGQWVRRAARDDITQRRENSRYPFFRAASIIQHGRELRAFCRDISPRGIGLLHDKPLDLGEATACVWLGDTLLDVELDVKWCKTAEGGWWLSGGRLSKVSSFQYASLMLSTIGREVERRFHRRYPFFRPFTVTEEANGQRAEHAAFSLDISHGGLSLLAPEAFGSRVVRLETAPGQDSPSEIRGRVASCRELQNQSFIIGIEFVSLQIMELC